MRKLRNLLMLLLALCLLLAACGGDAPAPVYTDPTEETRPAADHGEVTVLFTGDVQNIFAYHKNQGEIGYAALAAYRDALEDDGYRVILVDGGNAMDNRDAGALREGKTLAELIGSVGYDVRVVGETELSYGISAFRKLTERVKDCAWLSSNLLDPEGELPFASYALVDCGGIQVGFVGITAPGALGDGAAPDKAAFYAGVQDAIDAASDAGAAYVIAVGNLGTDPDRSPYTSAEVIANTTGLSAFLDCGSGAVLEGETVRDLDNYEIPVCAPGSSFRYVGAVTLNLNDGTAEVELLTGLEDQDKQIARAAAELTEELEPEPTEAPTEEPTGEPTEEPTGETTG